MTSSIRSVDSCSRPDMTFWRSTTQSRVCRTHFHGSDQSSKNTMRVSGIDVGVKRGLSNGANAGEGSERKYIDNRARISDLIQFSGHECVSKLLTLLVGIQNILVGIAKSKVICNHRLPSMPILRPSSDIRAEGVKKFLLRVRAPSYTVSASTKATRHLAPTQDYQILLWQLLSTRNTVEHGGPHALVFSFLALWPFIAASGCRFWTSKIGLSAHTQVFKVEMVWGKQSTRSEPTIRDALNVKRDRKVPCL